MTCRILLVDFLVGRVAGHASEYLGLLREALAPLRPDELTPFLGPTPPAGRLGRYVLFTKSMWRAFRRGDVVVFHTPEARDILVLAVLTTLSRLRRGRAVMMMRRGPEVFVGRHDWRARLLGRLVRLLTARGILHLTSDSTAAAETWTRMTGRPVPVISLPPRAAFVAARDGARQGPPQVALLGLFRQEKGIDRYEAVLRLAREIEPEARLFCQVADVPRTPLEQEVTTKITATYEGDPNAEVVAGHLTPDQYDQALLTSDVVVLPYEPALYTSGTSGLLFDALSAGAVVLSTRIRWGVDEFGDAPSIAWLPDRDEESIRVGLRVALDLARRRRTEGLPSDLPTGEDFASGWTRVISAVAET